MLESKLNESHSFESVPTLVQYSPHSPHSHTTNSIQADTSYRGSVEIGALLRVSQAGFGPTPELLAWFCSQAHKAGDWELYRAILTC
jgi:hypothetical protein